MKDAKKKCRFCDIPLPIDYPPFTPKPSPYFNKNTPRSYIVISAAPAPSIPQSHDESPDELGVYVCSQEDCVKKSAYACMKRHACQHLCCGILYEKGCLPCLRDECLSIHQQSGLKPEINQSGDDFCNICFVESLSASPSILLSCGHLFHYLCLKDRLARKWPGSAITFSFAKCPLCSKWMEHYALAREMQDVLSMHAFLEKESLRVMEADGHMKDERLSDPLSSFYQNPKELGMHLFEFYTCFRCKRPYYGGMRDCAQGVNVSLRIDIFLHI
jgi:hypothetical protein